MSALLDMRPLGAPPSPWACADPFLFCVHHVDRYPAGDERMAPATSLEGRDIGQDFAGKDGWRMYHGSTVPGFPQHPHRGFETVTILRRGYIDHSDSLGATARFGPGDVQWLTAGGGIVHAEMFPLLERDAPNPLELFQIWLNLPAADKLVDPHFAMLWSRDIPRLAFTDDAGRTTEVTLVAGALDRKRPPAPPPRSWAARADTDVAIWTVRMSPGARWTVPPAEGPRTRRTLYFFDGSGLRVEGERIDEHAAIGTKASAPVLLEAGDEPCDLLLLQGRPIAEPVVAHGPFVMNSRAEIVRAFDDYTRTRFGGWTWPADDPVHARDAGRFAKHADGRTERADAAPSGGVVGLIRS
jgi:redox-sensitive bicupin YhaK (pirin superfamily)